MPLPTKLAEGRATEFQRLLADPATFRAWYDAAEPVVRGFVHARCGGDDALVADITQEAFIAAVRSQDRYQGDADPVTWLCAIARNKLVDHFRRAGCERRRRDRLAAAAAPGRSPDELERVDEQDRLTRALRQLPEPHRTALILHHYMGLTTREVAVLLGRSEGATESLLTRSRAALRLLLLEP